MTRLARGGKWGFPSGGPQPWTGSARATPSRWSMRPEGQADEAHADVGEECPARWAPEQCAIRGVFVHGGRSVHRIETKSLWFSSTWTSAARARGSGGRPGFASDANASASRARPERTRPAPPRSAPGRGCARRPSPRRRLAPRGRPPTSRSITAAISAARVSDHPAVGQCQRLLRHDRLVASVALLTLAASNMVRNGMRSPLA